MAFLACIWEIWMNNKNISCNEKENVLKHSKTHWERERNLDSMWLMKYHSFFHLDGPLVQAKDLKSIFLFWYLKFQVSMATVISIIFLGKILSHNNKE